jgi:hypothetical protein
LRRYGTAGKSYCEVEALSGDTLDLMGVEGEECPLPTNRHHKVQARS